jgi:hypothetical protein
MTAITIGDVVSTMKTRGSARPETPQLGTSRKRAEKIIRLAASSLKG